MSKSPSKANRAVARFDGLVRPIERITNVMVTVLLPNEQSMRVICFIREFYGMIIDKLTTVGRN